MEKGKVVPEIVEKSYRDLPFLSDGRINYSDADRIPTVAVFLKLDDKILVLKRSKEVSNFQERWSVVTGYLDELEPLIEKAYKEIKEETGIEAEDVVSEEFSDPIEIVEDNRTWVTFPVLMELGTDPEINLNWESDEYKWIKVDNIDNLVPSSFLRCLNSLDVC